MSTAFEVLEIQRHQERIIAKQIAIADCWRMSMIRYALAAHLLKGCLKLHNRSPRPIARLKHSITMRTLERLMKW